MAQLTKSQLAAELESLRVAYERLKVENESLKSQLSARTPRRLPEASTPYQQVLRAAREQAMRTGKVVKVGGAQ